MKTTQRKGKSAFTLIELMAVITIIVILAGLVVGGMGFVNDRQAKEKARVQIALLSKALEEYKLDMGSYPATANVPSVSKPNGSATSAVSLYQALFKDGYDFNAASETDKQTWPATKATKIYLADLNPTATKQGWVANSTTMPAGNLPVLDPWGNQYCYRTAISSTGAANAATQNPDFDLWSMGKDGLSVPATPSNAGNLDDIKNF